MAKLVVVPHNMKSGGAKELAKTLSNKLGYKVFRVKPEKVRRRQAFVLRGGIDKLTQLNRFNAEGWNALSTLKILRLLVNGLQMGKWWYVVLYCGLVKDVVL